METIAGIKKEVVSDGDEKVVGELRQFRIQVLVARLGYVNDVWSKEVVVAVFEEPVTGARLFEVFSSVRTVSEELLEKDVGSSDRVDACGKLIVAGSAVEFWSGDDPVEVGANGCF